MQLKLDIKTLIIGIVLGVVLTALIGAGADSADAARFGIAIEPKGKALVKTSGGALYIISPEKGMAVRVLHAASIKADPDDTRNAKGRPFSLSGSSRSKKTSTDY